MIQCRGSAWRWGWQFRKRAVGFLISFNLCSCTVAQFHGIDFSGRLGETARLVEEVKAFETILGIEPTDALSRTVQERPAFSMLWLWLQRVGTLAVRGPI